VVQTGERPGQRIQTANHRRPERALKLFCGNEYRSRSRRHKTRCSTALPSSLPRWSLPRREW
jgi:hypothetical protein